MIFSPTLCRQPAYSGADFSCSLPAFSSSLFSSSFSPLFFSRLFFSLLVFSFFLFPLRPVALFSLFSFLLFN